DHRAGSQAGFRAASLDQSICPRPERSSQGIADPMKGHPVEVSPVVKSILGGRFDPDGDGPEELATSSSIPTRAPAGGRTTQAATGMERGATGADPALGRTEIDGAAAGDTNGPDRAHPHAPAPSSSGYPSSTSAILPGGTQLSSVEAGHRSFFRSVAQIGRQ